MHAPTRCRGAPPRPPETEAGSTGRTPPVSPEAGDAPPRLSLREVADHLGVNGSADWSGTFYQYTNRLAHLYLLSEANGLDAWLVFVYFIGDEAVKGPATREEWGTALEVLHGALGLRRHRAV